MEIPTLCRALQETAPWLEQFRKKTYEASFKAYTERYGPGYLEAVRAAGEEGLPGLAEELLDGLIKKQYEVEIRELNESDDRLAISAVYEASWKFAYRDILPREYLERIPVGRWVSGLDFAGRIHLMMLDGGRYTGAACCCGSRFPEFEGWGEVVSLYLLPEYMGHGRGRPLLEAAASALHGRGYEKIFLWVLEENRRARRFYERAGFRYGGISREDAIGGRAVRELAYCRVDRGTPGLTRPARLSGPIL